MLGKYLTKQKGSGTYNHSCLNEFLTVVSKAQNKPQWPEFPNFVQKLKEPFFSKEVNVTQEDLKSHLLVLKGKN